MREPSSVEPPAHAAEPVSAYKSRSGLQRILRATGYSWAGLKAAFRHEAAFRQELLLGLPLVVAAWWVGRTPLQVAALIGVVMLVWIVELLNSAIEAVADAVSLEAHPLVGRAKDLGSAAVMLTLLLVLLTWGAVIVQRWG
jgi:diacylglycerol kinase (ATP)